MMYNTLTGKYSYSALVLSKSKSYMELLKPRLSFLVAFSSGFGYILSHNGPVDPVSLILFSIGGFCVSGSALVVNQILERDLDKMMKRTRNRPIPTGRVSVQEAALYAAALAVVGLLVLYFTTNMATVALSVLSVILYAFVYTPLKRVGPIAVFVGAIPGAFPPLIGWVAHTGQIELEALIIFGIQFIWQFPHFWAIAWLADEDYKKAGFKLLPGNGKKDLRTAINIMTYTLFLLPLALLPAKFGVTGLDSAVIATVCGVLFLAQTFRLMRDNSRKSALKIMYGSFLYLPVVQIAYLLDKM
jgi:protoheme IX farnesyltransferase